MPDTVQLIDPSGRAHDVPFGDAAGLLTSGWHQQTTADTSRLAGEAASEADYGGLAGGAKALGYGLARGGSLGLSDIVARAAGVPKERLQGLKEQNEGLSIGAEIVGGLVPAFGAPGSLLARTPAGAVSGIGRTIVEATEGAGALSRAGTIGAGAAIEGGIYGGGQYLSQVALEDKPLAAEGFLGAMGKGALWAAPVGGALSLGADVLTRAKSLFPRAEVTREAARAVDREATSALSTAVRDGDTMLELARQRIAQTEAQAGASQTAERASRAMFGAADPAAMENQVAQSVERSKLTEAADRYTQAKARLDDWVRAEADPDLERALLRIRQPELQVGGPRLRSPEFGEVVPPQSRVPDLGEFGLERTNVGKRSALGTPGPHEPPRVPSTTELPPLPIADAPAPALPNPNDDLFAALGGTKQRLDEGEGLAAIAGRDIVRERPSGLEDLVRAQREAGPTGLERLHEIQSEAAAAVRPRSIEAVKAEYDDVMARLRASKDVPERRRLSKELDQLSDELDALGDYTPAVATKSAAPDAPATSGPEPIAKGKTISALKHPDETAENFVLRRMREQGEEFGDPEFNRKMGERKVFLGSLGIDWAVPENKALMFKMMREGDATFARADLVGAMDPAMVKASEIVEGRGGFGSESWHFIKDTGQPVQFPKAAKAAPARPSIESDLEAALRGTASQLDSGTPLGQLSRESPAAAEYVAKKIAKRGDDAAYFRARASQPSGLEGLVDAQRIASGEAAADDLFANLTKPRTRDAYVAQNIGRAMREEGSHATGLARLEREWAEMAGTGAVARKIVDRSIPIPPGLKVEVDDAIQSALRKHNGKNVDVGADLGRAAKAIGDVEEALAGLVNVLGPDAPATAAAHAKAWKAATEAQVEAAGKSAAKSATDIQSKVKPLLDADKTVVDDDVLKALRKAESADSAAANRAVEQLARKEGKAQSTAQAAATPAPAAPTQRRGALGLAADVGTALEVLNAMGVHVPDVSGIPVIGPVLSLYLKARAVLGILGRRGGSIGRSTESVVASKSAAVRDRVNAATAKLLDIGAAGARKATPIAGPAGALGYRLFPGDGETKSKDTRALYDARMDEIGRALQPGAIENAVADRIRTADPDLQDAIAAQARKGIEFLASKAPRESVLASMIPGDGKWHPSKAAIEKFSRYVAAVHDPAGVLEDLAHGHVSIESAETLRVVYPKLYAEAQRLLLEHASAFRATLPYSRRVSISLMYQVPVDGTMSPQHMQYLAAPTPGTPQQQPQASGPATTAPLQIGQQTLTSLERRAGA